MLGESWRARCAVALLGVTACSQAASSSHTSDAAGNGGANANGADAGGSANDARGGGSSPGGGSAGSGSAGSGSAGSGAFGSAGDSGGSAGAATSSGGTGGRGGGLAGASGSSSAGAGGTSGTGGGGTPFKGVANSPCAARTLLNVSWYYNWTEKETAPCSNGKGGEFIPMIWGHAGAEQSATGIQSAITGFVGKSYKYVLGFNEPDNATQSAISTATAISLLPSFNNIAVQVGTPATQANTTGQAWFKDYMAQVAANTSLRADFIAVHWYGWDAGSCDANASQLESYLEYAEGFPGNRPIWLTEWGCLNLSAPTVDDVVAFYKGALAVFAKHPRVQRYAWYPYSNNCALNNSDGSLSPLGAAYAAAPATK